MELEKFKNKIFKEIFRQSPRQKNVEILLSEFFLHKPIPTLQISYEFICRCRYNYDGEVFNHIKQLSYNPNSKNIKLQRCNYPNQQVFYAALPTNSDFASLISTAILETSFDLIKDEFITTHYLTLSRWHLKRPLNVFILPYSTRCITRNPEAKVAKENFDILIKSAFQNNPDVATYYLNSLEFISDCFCEIENKEKYYLVSAAYYNFIMNAAFKKGIAIDGLVYPSANTEAAGLNVVLRKELIDDNTIFCDYVVMYKGLKDRAKPKDYRFVDASNEVVPDNKGSFCFKHIW